MKIPARIAAPILLAVALSAAIGAFFLWQINTSIRSIEAGFGGRTDSGLVQRILGGSPTKRATGIVSQSQALVSLRQGEVFELKGIWKQAEDKYRESVAAGGGVPALRKLAAMQMQRREFDAAAETIRSIKSENPSSEETMLAEGLLALRSGDAKGAATIFSRKPDSAQGIYGTALVAIEQGDHEAAKANLAKAEAQTDPEIKANATTLNRAYREFALFPNGQDIHLKTLLARALAEVGECETSLRLLSGVVTAQSRYRDAWIVKGYCEYASERTKDALASLEQAYALDPEKPEIQYFLARTHAALGDPQNAVTFLQYAIINGFRPERDARELLADYAQELGNTDLALEQLQALAAKDDSDLSVFERYVTLAAGIERHALDALTLSKTALTRWPNNPDALALAARAALAAGLPDDAKTYVDKALSIDPKNQKAQQVAELIKKNGAKE